MNAAARWAPTVTGSSVQESLTGTVLLLRFMLRQDRLRLSLWVLGIGLMSFYVANAVQAIVSDEEELVQMAGVFTDPVGRLMTGPAYGMAEPTFERFYAAGYALFIYLLIALMSIFTVIRHTRGEEASGRAELLRANVLGRHATLAAAVLLVFLSTICATFLVMLGALSGGFAVPGSLLVAGSGAAVGLFFAAVGAVSAQLTEASRAASAVAGSVLGLSYLIRMGGDAAATGGTTLSWFSPLGWSQQTAPYVQDRWWPLLLPGALTVAGLLWAFHLSTRRDLGAGLFPGRPGPARARPSLGTPLGIAWESLRGGLRGWGLALVLCGAMFGGYAQTMVEAAGDLPEQFQQVFTGESLMLGYLAYIGLFLAILVAAAGVNAVQQIRGEESQGRAALLLTAPLGRRGWLIAHVAVLVLGLALILLLVGLATGCAAAAVLHQDRAQHFVDLLLASLHQGPAVLAVLGLVVAVFGWAPRFTGVIGWAVVGYAAVMTNFGRLLDLPGVMQNFNVFSHLSPYPVEPVTWAPVLVLSALGVAGLMLGVLGWQRREITSG